MINNKTSYTYYQGKNVSNEWRIFFYHLKLQIKEEWTKSPKHHFIDTKETVIEYYLVSHMYTHAALLPFYTLGAPHIILTFKVFQIFTF